MRTGAFIYLWIIMHKNSKTKELNGRRSSKAEGLLLITRAHSTPPSLPNFVLCDTTRSYVMEHRSRTPVAGMGSEGVRSPGRGHLVVPEHRWEGAV